MALRWLCRLAVALVLVAGLLGGEARAADDAELYLNQDVTWVGRFRYNPKQQTILLPVSGLLPSLSWNSRPRHVTFKVAYLDVPGMGPVPARLTHGTQRRFPGNRLVELIMVSEPRPGLVRLVVRGSRPVRLDPELVAYRKGWAVRVKVRPIRQPRR